MGSAELFRFWALSDDEKLNGWCDECSFRGECLSPLAVTPFGSHSVVFRHEEKTTSL